MPDAHRAPGRQDGCCADWPKPCSCYHEGWQDALDGLRPDVSDIDVPATAGGLMRQHDHDGTTAPDLSVRSLRADELAGLRDRVIHRWPDSAMRDDALSLLATLAALEAEHRRGIYGEITSERSRAHAKHGDTSMESFPVDSLDRLAILTEEVGEVAKEFNDARHDRRAVDLAALRKELVQTATMAAAWADMISVEEVAP